MESNKKEAIAKLIFIIIASILGGLIFYWGFTFVYWVIKYALQG